MKFLFSRVFSVYRLLLFRFVPFCLFLGVFLSGAFILSQSLDARAAFAASCPLKINTPYRAPKISTVFIITSSCEKRPIFNPDVYFSYYADWTPVIFVEQPVLDAIADHPLHFMPWGPRRVFQNGSLLKTTDDPRVYLLEERTLHPFASEQAFKAFGYTFDQVEDVSPDVFTQFTSSAQELSDLGQAPASLVFKYLNDPSVYVLKTEGDVLVKSHILTIEDLKTIARPDRIAIFPLEKTFPTGEETGSTSVIPSVSSSASTDPIALKNLPANVTSTVSGSLSLEAVVLSSASVSSVKYLIGNTEVGFATSSLQKVSVNTARFSNNAYILTAIITHSDGSTSTLTRTIRVNNVASSGGGGGGVGGGGGGGSSAPAADTTAPIISSIASSTTPASIAITWTTNEGSNSVIQYGTSTGYGSASSSNALVTNHSITLTGLVSGTVYHLKILSTDASNNTAQSSDFIVTTSAPDTTDPVISSVASSTAVTTATITWTTDEASTSKVEYGTTASYGSASSSSLLVTNHSIAIAGLASNTSYHFRVSSQDASGNQTVGTDYVFRTTDGTAPTVTSFVIPSSSRVRVILISAFTATDNTAVTGYLLTESSGAPSSTAIGWTASSPTNYSFVSDGSKTLYAWAKDAQGNVSASLSAAVLIDATAPIISSIASTTAMTAATITWTTNEASTSTVFYGATASYGSSSSSVQNVTSHSITLTSLAANTAYHFKIASQDVLGNVASSTDYTFRTSAAPDNTAPAISAVASSTAATTATITWTTNEASTSTVEYGATSSYGSTSSSNSFVASHSIVLNGLTSSTTYHFRVSSQDASGNRASSTDYTFRTTEAPTGTTYYMATNGSDSNPGTSGQPWATFSHAFGVMSGGDELVVKDGTYRQTLRDAPEGSDSVGYTVVRAEHDFKVTILASLDFALYVNSNYLQVEGFKFNGESLHGVGVVAGHHVKIMKSAFYGAPTNNNNASVSTLSGSHHVLFEDCWAWGGGRYKFVAYQSDYVIFRRCVSRQDYENDADDQAANFTNYDSPNVLYQNVIALDSGHHPEIYGNNYGGIWFENNEQVANNITTQGSIFLNLGTFTFNDPKIYGAHRFENVVAWDVLGGAAFMNIYNNWQGVTNPSVVADHITMGGVYGTTTSLEDTGQLGIGWTGAYPGYNDFPISINNSSFYKNNTYAIGIDTHSDYNNFYANTENYRADGYGTGTHDTFLNPGQKYITRIEDDSLLKGAASDGGDRGANILKRYGVSGTLWGESGYDQLTDVDLWPYPYEDEIKADMSSYVLPVGVGPADYGQRGFATTTGVNLSGGPVTLTSYIWEYLGNPCPVEICGVMTDITAPIISAVASSTTATTATITWTTDEAATSTVSYGTTVSYGSTSSSSSLVTSHSVFLTGLNSNMLYHFNVASQDASGNRASSTDYTFRTP